MNVNYSEYSIRLLSDVPHLADQCCQLLNSEWKRSHTARMRTLNKINDRFPINIILIQDSGNFIKTVVGHCRVSIIRPVESNRPAAFLESVVITHKLRGCGLGRHLMTEVEDYLIKRGVDTVYLTTRGQEQFYAKCGYKVCEPIDVFTSAIDPAPDAFKEFSQKKSGQEKETSISFSTTTTEPKSFSASFDSVSCSSTVQKKKCALQNSDGLINIITETPTPLPSTTDTETSKTNIKLPLSSFFRNSLSELSFNKTGEINERLTTASTRVEPPPPPPPPPPLPQACSKTTCFSFLRISKTYMYKTLVNDI